jgi:hypothetical protein
VKSCIIAVFVLPGAAAFAQQQASVPEIPFDSNPSFLKLPPDMHLGEVSGIAVNSKGDIAVFTRTNSAGGPAYGATASQVMLFDKTGKFPARDRHGPVRVVVRARDPLRQGRQPLGDRQGSDMIVRFNPRAASRWCSAARRKRRTTPSRGRASRRRGRRCTVSSASRPTSRGTPQGNIYISDGYINSRVAKFTKDGDWVASIGEPGRTKLGELNTPHTIANDAKGNIYVGDRGNRRIQVIDPKTNTFVRQMTIDVPIPPDAIRGWARSRPAEAAATQVGAPWAICITRRTGDSVSLRLGCVPRPRLQADARRPGGRHARQVRAPAEAVRLDPRDRVAPRTRSTWRSC